MRKLTRFLLSAFAFALAVLSVPGLKAKADQLNADAYYVSDETGYKVLIYDGAHLFTQDELDRLAREDMFPITQYCDCILYTTDVNPYSTTESKPMAKALFDNYGKNFVCFMIDMATRDLRLQSPSKDNPVLDESNAHLTDAKSDSIMDNVFRYASNGEWYTCAHETFDQTYRVLSGSRISEPMRYISAAFLAVAVALLGNFIALKISTVNWDEDTDELLKNVKDANLDITNVQKTITKQTRTYSPPSSSSSGGGGGGGGGFSGGGGGGGSSGGSHHF